MAYVSKLLRAFQPDVEDQKLKVVVGLSGRLDDSIRHVARRGETRRRALTALHAAGMRGGALDSPGFRPASLIAGQRVVSAEMDVRELDRLAATEGVAFIRPQRIHRAHLDESRLMVGGDAAERSGFDGSGVRVAVVDSGIDHTHPDLAGRVNLARSRNFTDEGTASDVTDGNGHGTHVAAIIGGSGRQYRGVAPAVEFIACKVFDASGRSSSEAAVSEAVRWAVEHGADVINYSGGFAPLFNGVPIVEPPWVWPLELVEEEEEFRKAMEAGVVCVVSAGNEGEHGDRGTLSMPATCRDVISVGAIDKGSAVSGFSSRGPAYRSSDVHPADFVESLRDVDSANVRRDRKVDVIAPGGEVSRLAGMAGGCFYKPGIISAKASALHGPTPCDVDNNHRKSSGTSQAAPHVAGLAALIVAASRDRNVALGPRPAYGVKRVIARAASRLANYPRRTQGDGLPSWPDVAAVLDALGA